VEAHAQKSWYDWWERPPAGEPIIAWRAWKVWQVDDSYRYDANGLWYRSKIRGLRLVSLNGTHWEPREEMTARTGTNGKRCLFGRESRHPSFNCTCGVHAHGTRELMLVELRNEIAAHPHDNFYAFGRVALRGNFVRGEKGWRAEFAYPYDVYLVNCGDREVAREIAQAYAVDVSYGPMPDGLGRIPASDEFTISPRTAGAGIWVGSQASGVTFQNLTINSPGGRTTVSYARTPGGSSIKTHSMKFPETKRNTLAERVGDKLVFKQQCPDHGIWYEGKACPKCFQQARPRKGK
jgi:hypothetical protein